MRCRCQKGVHEGVAERVVATLAAKRVVASLAGGIGGISKRVFATLAEKKDEKSILAGDWVSSMVLVVCGGSENLIVLLLHLASNCVWLLTPKLPAPGRRWLFLLTLPARGTYINTHIHTHRWTYQRTCLHTS